MPTVDRKLASIRRVDALAAIPNADNIELVHVDGWQLVGVKGEFLPGDPCVYFEIDSFLPLKEEFAFLAKTSLRNHVTMGQGYRLATRRFRGQISQGLALPLCKVFAESEIAQLQDGDDVTELLGVQKWVDVSEAVPTSSKAIDNFPTDIVPKTNQERIQNCFKWILDKTCDDTCITTSALHPCVKHTWEVTLKLDGTSCTILHDPLAEFGPSLRVFSRNLELDVKASCTHTHVAKQIAAALGARGQSENSKNHDADSTTEKSQQEEKTNIEVNANATTDTRAIALQGEIMGPKINGNREKLLRLEFFLFDIYDIAEKQYWRPAERRAFCARYNLQHAPVLQEAAQAPESVAAVLAYADGLDSISHPVAEGVVYKRNDGRSSFKVISNKYLLKKK